MPVIVALRDLVSLHATTQLVHAGYRAQWGAPNVLNLTIVGATTASPIVVTTATPHGVRPGTAIHAVVQGVTGNTAANNVDTATPQQSSTSGMCRAWVAVATGATTLALYDAAPGSGARVASTGNGAYAGGGTLSKAFTEGLILLGQQWIFAQSFPPRVVWIPRGHGYSPKAVADPRMSAAESARMRSTRSIRTKEPRFEVHVFGVGAMGAGSRDVDTDYTATEVLEEQIIRSAHLLGAGVFDVDAAEWADDAEGETGLLKAGHELVFGLTFMAPITDRQLDAAPADVAPEVTTQLLVPGSNVPETGCSDA